jgi:hypothetical protein
MVARTSASFTALGYPKVISALSCSKPKLRRRLSSSRVSPAGPCCNHYRSKSGKKVRRKAICRKKVRQFFRISFRDFHLYTIKPRVLWIRGRGNRGRRDRSIDEGNPLKKKGNKSMKRSLFKWGLAPLLACAFLAPRPLLAQAVQVKSTGWLIAELLPGVACISSAGQFSLKNEVHVIRSEGDDWRVTGKMQAVMNLVTQADGTSSFSGTSTLEVGTWNADGTFTPSGMVWDVKYKGIANATGTAEYHMIGIGIGGSIDGLHITATGTRASGLPTVPYLFSGKISSMPEK